jgi:predicted transcriptional regulator
LKRREGMSIYADILMNLQQGPLFPTRLAQACNLNFAALMKHLEALEQGQLVARTVQEGHEMISATRAGWEWVEGWKLLWNKVKVPLI